MAWTTLGKVFFSSDLPTDFLGLLPFLDDCFYFFDFLVVPLDLMYRRDDTKRSKAEGRGRG